MRGAISEDLRADLRRRVGDIPAGGTLALRPATSGDAELLYRILEQSAREVVEATFGAWDEAWQRDRFARRTDPTTHDVILDGASPVGCLHVEESAARVDLHRILLLPEAQGRGIGTALIDVIAAAASERGKPVRLRVFRVNPARALYERLGFAIVERTETHLIMERTGRENHAR